jgi:radical SAM protein with 4Fe4S-binding SPASM domain
MLRVTEYIRDTLKEKPVRPVTDSVILIWNLTNRCNLFCHHCYANSRARKDHELSYEQIVAALPSLWKEGVRFIILSGGEPLIRKDIYEIATAMREQGFKTYLSSNGLLVNDENIPKIKEHFDYVGISIDGRPEIHDRFRAMEGAYERSLRALVACKEAGIRVGMRYTLSQMTLPSLSYILDLTEELEMPKLYISHLVYAGRAEAASDLTHDEYIEAMGQILNRAYAWVSSGAEREIVTGNNEADAIFLLGTFALRYPHLAPMMEKRLLAWGGNQAAVRMANINPRGEVRPDPFFRDALGSLQEHDFSTIWQGLPEKKELLESLRMRPRPIKGKCVGCAHLPLCNGNSRARAYAFSQDYMAEDPACVF